MSDEKIKPNDKYPLEKPPLKAPERKPDNPQSFVKDSKQKDHDPKEKITTDNKMPAAEPKDKHSIKSLILGLLLSGSSYAAVNSETQNAATKMGANAVSEISFSKDSVELTESAKTELQKLIGDSNKKGTVSEVRVAVWADQEYPGKKTAAADNQISLAEKRAKEVRAYLENNLYVTSVRTINMAERPSVIQNILKTPTAKTKNTLEVAGAAPTNSDQTGLLGLKGKASEAVVLVYMH